MFLLLEVIIKNNSLLQPYFHYIHVKILNFFTIKLKILKHYTHKISILLYSSVLHVLQEVMLWTEKTFKLQFTYISTTTIILVSPLYLTNTWKMFQLWTVRVQLRRTSPTTCLRSLHAVCHVKLHKAFPLTVLYDSKPMCGFLKLQPQHISEARV